MTYAPDSLSGFKAPIEKLNAAVNMNSYAAPSRQVGQQSHHSRSNGESLPGDNRGRSAAAFEAMNDRYARTGDWLIKNPVLRFVVLLIWLTVIALLATTFLGKALPQTACDSVHFPAPCPVTQLP